MLHLPSVPQFLVSTFTSSLAESRSNCGKVLLRCWLCPRPPLKNHGTLSFPSTQSPTPAQLHQPPTPPFPPFKCNPSSSCCLAPHARTSRQHRNQAPISSVFFEYHCTIELLKWQSTLAVQTCTYLNTVDCNCRTWFKLLA